MERILRRKLTNFAQFILIFCALWSLSARAAQQDFTIEPIPDWTSPIEVKEYDNPLEKQASAGVFVLLLDTELNGATQERYFRFAEKFLSASGVENNSRLSFSFDPSYQQLILHKIVVHRGNEVLDQLNPAKFHVIQQEKELDRLIYNGAKTALLFLEDVRVGDWVEYAYTIRGRNPVEYGHFYDGFQMRWSFPIQTENYRLLWPRNFQPLWVQLSGDPSKNRNVTEQYYEYSWHWENRAGQEPEDFTPITTTPYAFGHFSDFDTWSNVAAWASQTYQTKALSKELQDRISSIQSEAATEEEKATRALQFVQDDIRYLGIENGINSHTPTDPSLVFARGYGDCKDKALLFCTILQSMGIQAAPVLVSTRLRERVRWMIPTPWAFDHAIVQVSFPGKTNYVDVTRSFQRGPLEKRFIDNFGAGVLLGQDSPGLIKIPFSDAGTPITTIEENFNVFANAPTELTVRKTFYGSDADFVRQELAISSRDSLEKAATAYYKKFYSDIVLARPTETLDDEKINRISVIERFTIPSIWKPATQTNYIACGFYSDGFTERLFIPIKKDRTQPLAVPFPEDYIHRIRIQTHETFRLVPVDKEIRNKAFLFHHRTTCTNNEINVFDQLLTLNLGINAADVPGYLEDLNQLPRFLDLEFTKPVPGLSKPGSPNWTIWIAVSSYCAVMTIGAVALYRYKPKSPPLVPFPAESSLQGIGGWLLVIGFGLVGSIVSRLYFFTKLAPIFSNSSWSVITEPASVSYDPGKAPLLLFELFAQITLFFLILLLTVLFFQKRRIFPILFVTLLVLQFVFSVLDTGFAAARKSKVATTAKEKPSPVVPVTIGAFVWGTYMLRSKRVKCTFLN